MNFGRQLSTNPDTVRSRLWRAANREKYNLSQAERNARHKALHPNAVAERVARYRKRHPDRVAEQIARYKRENPQRSAAYSKKWRDANPQKVVEHNARSGALWRAANPGKNYEKVRRWQAKNPDKHAAQRATRRARKKLAVVPLTDQERAEIVEIYARARALTKSSGEMYHVDHIMPLVRGGLHHPKNLQVMRAVDNLRKGTKMLLNETRAP